MNILITLLIVIIGTAGILIYIFNYKPRSKARVKDLYAEGLDLLIAGKRKAAYQNFKDIIDNPYFLPFSVLFSIFIFYTHRSNIQRMLYGNENRFEKAMIFRKNT